MKRRPSGSFLVSIALHLALGAALLYIISLPLPISKLFSDWTTPAQPPAEHVGYIALPHTGPPTPGRSGGDNRPVRPHVRAAPRMVAPRTAPTQLPPIPHVDRTPQGGSGPVVGAGGATQGVVPSFSDPRVWTPAGAPPPVPRGMAAQLDSMLAERIQLHNDSMAIIAKNAGRKPGDWTFNKGGKKYGIDQKYIYVGSIKIPTALLALLPLNIQGNPTEIQRDRALSRMHADIMENAQRALNEQEFKDAVKRVRERKQREHDAALLAKKKGQQRDRGTGDPPQP
ncbi:MAG TPA: hypothetical protein VFW98_02595 [Gemmatimonadaceae bacterium]|nr:hypothetical protein [Gemmatimonadaceae bacterium]